MYYITKKKLIRDLEISGGTGGGGKRRGYWGGGHRRGVLGEAVAGGRYWGRGRRSLEGRYWGGGVGDCS